MQRVYFAIAALVVATTVPLSADTTGATTSYATTLVDSRQLAEASSIAQLCGIDIDARDVANFKSANPDNCLIPCYMRVRESNAATWTSFEGGTCWCKTLKTTGGLGFISQKNDAVTLLNPGILPSPSDVFFAAGNRDLPGNDLDNVPAKDESACAKACLNRGGCFAYTWTDYNSGTCWMKSKVSKYIDKPGARSGYVARAFVRNACRP